MEYDFEKSIKENKMDISVIDARRFAQAIRESIKVLDHSAACYKLTNKAYYLETKEFLGQQAARLEAGNSIEEKVESLKRELFDLEAVYADVCNRIDPSQPDEELLAMQRYIEHQFALAMMEEYSWEKTDEGKWRYVSDKEFYARLRANKRIPAKEE